MTDPLPWSPGLVFECPGDCCPCQQAGSPREYHKPAFVAYSEAVGQYVTAATRCSARETIRGDICGQLGTRHIAGIWLCDRHFAWLREEVESISGRLLFLTLEHERRLHAERMKMDREQMAQRVMMMRDLRARAEFQRAGESFVYYIRRESDGLVKIGTSRVIAGRFKALRGEHGPILLMAAEAGDLRRERGMHRRFADLRVSGEWFRPELPLLEYIGRLRASSLTGMRGIRKLPWVSVAEIARMIREASGP